jgi:hypothetical protein
MLSEQKQQDRFSFKRVLLKGLLLFLFLNLAFAPLHPLPLIGRLSAYNLLFPGRARLPYGEKPDQAYNLSLFSLEAMFASHELSAGDKPTDEYRVLLIGDSSVWGFLLKPENTLAANINAANLRVADGRIVRAYNLGYPTMSLTKDLLILSNALHYQPDLIIWLVTLESFPRDKQLDSPIVQHNPSQVQNLITTYSLNLDPHDPAFVINNFWSDTIIGQRRALADILRLQFYGIMWAATSIDQYYPETYEPPQEDLAADVSFHNLQPPTLKMNDLSMEILSAGSDMAGNIPIMFVNEPIYLSHGENSDIRYNFFYPRWAYDQYRQLLTQTCQQKGWFFLDEWNLVPPSEFTNSAIHLTPFGSQMLAEQVANAVLTITNH